MIFLTHKVCAIISVTYLMRTGSAWSPETVSEAQFSVVVLFSVSASKKGFIEFIG